MVKDEISFRRDHSFSLWHRQLKNDWYIQDIDYQMFQVYNNECQTLALIEQKNANIKTIDLNDFQFKALRNLAKDIPVFVLLTNNNEEKNYLNFYLIAANNSAKQFLLSAGQKDRRYLTESDYVAFEAYLRKEKPSYMKLDKACILLDKFKLPKIINYE